jgi:hypothetical protein
MEKKELKRKAITTFLICALILLFIYIIGEGLSLKSTNVNSSVDEKEGEAVNPIKDDGSIKTTGEFMTRYCDGTYYGSVKTIDSESRVREEKRITIILFNSIGKSSGKYYYTDTVTSYEGYYYTKQNNKIYFKMANKEQEFTASDECDKMVKTVEDVKNNLTINYKLKRVA